MSNINIIFQVTVGVVLIDEITSSKSIKMNKLLNFKFDNYSSGLVGIQNLIAIASIICTVIIFLFLLIIFKKIVNFYVDEDVDEVKNDDLIFNKDNKTISYLKINNGSISTDKKQIVDSHLLDEKTKNVGENNKAISDINNDINLVIVPREIIENEQKENNPIENPKNIEIEKDMNLKTNLRVTPDLVTRDFKHQHEDSLILDSEEKENSSIKNKIEPGNIMNCKVNIRVSHDLSILEFMHQQDDLHILDHKLLYNLGDKKVEEKNKKDDFINDNHHPKSKNE